MAGNITVYMSIQDTKILQSLFPREKKPTLPGNKHHSLHFSFQNCVFSILRQKHVPNQSVRKGHQSGYPRADTIGNNINKKRVFHKKNLHENAQNLGTIHKIKYKKGWIRFISTCVYKLLLLCLLLGAKLGFFLVSVPHFISWFCILAEEIRNDRVAACSTALRSATEKNELGGNVTVPCPFKVTQRSSTEDCFSF